MDIDATQAIPLSDYDDETDEEIPDEEKKPRAHLQVPCQKGFPATSFPVYEGINLIGRAEGCNVYIPLKALSKEHAVIEVTGDQHFIVDKGSKNKTRRGKLFLMPEARYELRGGDELTFGDLKCSYKMESKRSTEEDDKTDSELGSEPMFTQNKPEVEEETVYFDPPTDGSEPSSDILQPTQAFAADGTGPLQKKREIKGGTQHMYVEDSDNTDDEGADVPLISQNAPQVIAETPAPGRSKKVTTDCVPDSGDESGAEVPNVPETVMFEEDTAEDTPARKKIAEEATQAFTDGGDLSPSKKLDLGGAATMAFDYEEDTTDDEGGKDKPFQNYARNDTGEFNVTGGVKGTGDVETQAVGDMETQAVGDMETQAVCDNADAKTGEDETQVFKETSSGKTNAKLQAQTSDDLETQIFAEETVPVGVMSSTKTNAKLQAQTSDDVETQIFADETVPVGGKPNIKATTEAETQLFTSEDETVPVSGSTASPKRKSRSPSPHKTSPGSNVRRSPRSRSRSPVIETTPKQSNFKRPKSKSPTPKKSVAFADEPTQIFGEDATVGVEDQPTQVFDEPTLVVNNNQLNKPAVDTSAAETQVFGEPETQILSVSADAVNSKPATDSTQALGDAETQVFGETVFVSPNCIPSAKHKKSAAVSATDATQIFDEQTQVLELPQKAVKSNRGQGDNVSATDATQVFDEAETQVFDETITVSARGVTGKGGKPLGGREGHVSATDATQIFDEATQVLELQGKPRKVGQVSATDATQMFDEPTQVFGSDTTRAGGDNTIVVSKVVGGKTNVMPAVDDTMVFQQETQVYSDGDTDTANKTPTIFKRKAINEMETQVFESPPACNISVFDPPASSTQRFSDSSDDVNLNLTVTPEAEDRSKTVVSADEPTQIFDDDGFAKPMALPPRAVPKAPVVNKPVPDCEPTVMYDDDYESDEDILISSEAIPVSESKQTLTPKPNVTFKEPEPVKKTLDSDLIATQAYGSDTDSETEDDTKSQESTKSQDSTQSLELPKTKPVIDNDTLATQAYGDSEDTEDENVAPLNTDDLATQAFDMDVGDEGDKKGPGAATEVIASSQLEEDNQPIDNLPDISSKEKPKRGKKAADDKPLDDEKTTRGRKTEAKMETKQDESAQKVDNAEEDMSLSPEVSVPKRGRRAAAKSTVSNDKINKEEKEKAEENVPKRGRRAVASKTDETEQSSKIEETSLAEEVKAEPSTSTRGRRGKLKAAEPIAEEEESKVAEDKVPTKGKQTRGSKQKADEDDGEKDETEDTKTDEVKSKGKGKGKQTRGRKQIVAEDDEKHEIDTEIETKQEETDSTLQPKGKGKQTRGKKQAAEEQQDETPEGNSEIETKDRDGPVELQNEPPTKGRGKGRHTRGKHQSVSEEQEEGETKMETDKADEDIKQEEESKPQPKGKGKQIRGKKETEETTEAVKEPVGARSRRGTRGKAAEVKKEETKTTTEIPEAEGQEESTETTTVAKGRAGRGAKKGKNVVKTEVAEDSEPVGAKPTRGSRGKAAEVKQEPEQPIANTSRSSRRQKQTPPATPQKHDESGDKVNLLEESPQSKSPQVEASVDVSLGRGRRAIKRNTKYDDDVVPVTKVSRTSIEKSAEVTTARTGRGRRSKADDNDDTQSIASNTSIESKTRGGKKGRNSKAEIDDETQSIASNTSIESNTRRRRGRASKVDSPLKVEESDSSTSRSRTRGSKQPEPSPSRRGRRNQEKEPANEKPENKKTEEPAQEEDDFVICKPETSRGKKTARKSKAKGPSPGPSKIKTEKDNGESDIPPPTRGGRRSTAKSTTTEPPKPPTSPKGKNKGGRGKKAAPDSMESINEEQVKVETTRRGGKRGVSLDNVSVHSNQSESSQPERKRRKTTAVHPEPSTPSTPSSRRKSVLLTPSSTPSSRRQSMTPSGTPHSLRQSTLDRKHKVMFTGVVDEKGQKVVKSLGGEIVSSINECTHLVTDKVRRTVKFLCGLAKGIMIVNMNWLDSCASAHTFIDANGFLIDDSESERKFHFTLSRSIEKASQRSLFEGYKIHVTKNVKPDPTQMKEIISCAGAQYLTTMPKKYADNTVIVSCKEDKAACNTAIKCGLPVVDAEFILTGILQQELNVDSYLLFKETTAAAESQEQPNKRKRKK